MLTVKEKDIIYTFATLIAQELNITLPEKTKTEQYTYSFNSDHIISNNEAIMSRYEYFQNNELSSYVHLTSDNIQHSWDMAINVDRNVPDGQMYFVNMTGITEVRQGYSSS